jgi:hypothetical protein
MLGLLRCLIQVLQGSLSVLPGNFIRGVNGKSIIETDQGLLISSHLL